MTCTTRAFKSKLPVKDTRKIRAPGQRDPANVSCRLPGIIGQRGRLHIQQHSLACDLDTIPRGMIRNKPSSTHHARFTMKPWGTPKQSPRGHTTPEAKQAIVNTPCLLTHQPCSNSPSWPSRSRGRVSVVTHKPCRSRCCVFVVTHKHKPCRVIVATYRPCGPARTHRAGQAGRDAASPL